METLKKMLSSIQDEDWCNVKGNKRRPRRPATTSTPKNSHPEDCDCTFSPDVSVIEHSSSEFILGPDDSSDALKSLLQKISDCEQSMCSNVSSKRKPSCPKDKSSPPLSPGSPRSSKRQRPGTPRPEPKSPTSKPCSPTSKPCSPKCSEAHSKPKNIIRNRNTGETVASPATSTTCPAKIPLCASDDCLRSCTSISTGPLCTDKSGTKPERDPKSPGRKCCGSKGPEGHPQSTNLIRIYCSEENLPSAATSATCVSRFKKEALCSSILSTPCPANIPSCNSKDIILPCPKTSNNGPSRIKKELASSSSLVSLTSHSERTVPPRCSILYSRNKPCIKTESSPQAREAEKCLCSETANCKTKPAESKQEDQGILGFLAKLAAWSPRASEPTEPQICTKSPCSTVSKKRSPREPREGKNSPRVRCVHFKSSKSKNQGVCPGVEQLYINEGVKKSDAPVPSNSCAEPRPRPRGPVICVPPDNTCEGARYAKESKAPHGASISFDGAVDSPKYPCDMPDVGGAPCGVGSGTVSEAARACFYHNKLLATLQILQNKDETMRVQTESLAVAESRIAALTARASQMKRELDAKQQEICDLKTTKCPCKPTVDSCTGTPVDKPKDVHCWTEASDNDSDNDRSCAARIQEVQRQKAMVATLQKNLSVIEELYRECFYESAKQEALIDVLRNSYLDVRLRDREGSGGGDANSVQRCQELAVEVDNLKMEISNFLSSSNNDSGVWSGGSEGSGPGGDHALGEELQQITDQLMMLRDILASECTCQCGFDSQDDKLKEENDALQLEATELRCRVSELEEAIQEKERCIQHYKSRLEEKEQEVQCGSCEVSRLQEQVKQREATIESLTARITPNEEALRSCTTELCAANGRVSQLTARCAQLDGVVQRLQQSLEKAEAVCKQNCTIRSEVSYLTQQVALWRQQLEGSEQRARQLEAELEEAREHARQQEQCYRSKAMSVSALQQQLEAAHARGAELCKEARGVVGGVRGWCSRMRTMQRKQEQKIQEQSAMISSLRAQLSANCAVTMDSHLASHSSTTTTGCSKCSRNKVEPSPVDEACEAIHRLDMLTQDRTPSCLSRTCPGRSGPSEAECDCVGEARPPRSGRNSQCSGSSCSRSGKRSSHQPVVAFFPPDSYFETVVQPATRELNSRVERLQEALCDGMKRWKGKTAKGPRGPHR